MYVSIYLIEFQIQTKIDTHLGKNLQLLAASKLTFSNNIFSSGTIKSNINFD